MAAVERLECPVCLELPEGEVHQCNEGHCCCVSCWNRLEEPRRCPECRQPLPQANRNRAVERAIAALEWSCEHCNEATTRGAKAAHLAACPQVPTACAAAAAGCGWAGMMSEQAAHDSACPFAMCQRMMAPLLAQNQQLQSECQELRGQNQQLQLQVAALRSLPPTLTPAGPAAADALHLQMHPLPRRVVAAAGPRVTAGKGGGADGGSRSADRGYALRAVTGARAGGRGGDQSRDQGRGGSVGRSVASARETTLGLAMDYASLE